MLEIRRTTEADLPALSRLFEHGFGRPFEAAEWEWKYRRLPGEARSLVALDAAGEVVAHVGAYALPVRWRGGERPGWHLADFVGRPGGLRPPLVTAGRILLADLPRAEDLPCIFGFPSSRHLALGERVFGYRWLPPREVWEGALDALPAGDGAAIVSSGDTADDWAAEVWQACAVDGVRRDASFLNWRYYARPERYYRIYRLRSSGSEALVVAAFAGDLASLAELWLPPGADWRPALRAVAADLRASGLRRWRSWVPAQGDDVLRALAMQPVGEPVPCGCRGPTGGGDEVLDVARSLYYAMGDHDLV